MDDDDDNDDEDHVQELERKIRLETEQYIPSFCLGISGSDSLLQYMIIHFVILKVEGISEVLCDFGASMQCSYNCCVSFWVGYMYNLMQTSETAS